MSVVEVNGETVTLPYRVAVGLVARGRATWVSLDDAPAAPPAGDIPAESAPLTVHSSDPDPDPDPDPVVTPQPETQAEVVRPKRKYTKRATTKTTKTWDDGWKTTDVPNPAPRVEVDEAGYAPPPTDP